MKNRVVVTGMGTISPLGNSVAALWHNLLEGVSGAGPITKFDASQYKTVFACEVKNFDPLQYFDKKEARHLDVCAQYGIAAAEDAVADSRLDLKTLDLTRCGVIFSSGIGGITTFENELHEAKAFDLPRPRFNPFFITKIIANSLAGYISIRYGFNGINSCPVTACASSNQAIIDAFNYIKWGKADLIIAGGSEAPITRAGVGGFNALQALSSNNENFKSASKPFDKDRDGFVVGEGASALVIESLEHALKRGAPILAEILGGGQASDAYHITGTHPEGLGASLAMKESIVEAGIQPEQIQYLNAHATSTGPGDISEVKAIKKVFGEHSRKLLVSSTKSMTGHLLGGAGALEAIITAKTLIENKVPATINTQILDPVIEESGVNIVTGNSRDAEVTYALNNSFGFGGHCASLVLGKIKEEFKV